jgi:hypothetical protein
LGNDEADLRPVHPLIAHVDVPTLDPDAAWAIDAFAGSAAVTHAMRALCDEKDSSAGRGPSHPPSTRLGRP